MPEARQGALRVLEAARAADVKRIVLTSSMVAMMYRPNRPAQILVTETDWNDPGWKQLSAYIVSKTRAGKAAWDWADKNGWKPRLTVVNPGFVLGPALDDEAPRSKLRGIKAELRRSRTRLRSEELRRGSPCLSSLQQAAGYSGEGE